MLLFSDRLVVKSLFAIPVKNSRIQNGVDMKLGRHERCLRSYHCYSGFHKIFKTSETCLAEHEHRITTNVFIFHYKYLTKTRKINLGS